MTKGLHKNSLRKVDNPHQWMIDDARMGLIQQIKAEIERLKHFESSDDAWATLCELERFLDTLQEQPIEDKEELSDFESALFSAFSDMWQSYMRGEEINVAEHIRRISPQLLLVASRQNKQPACEDVSREEVIGLSIMAYLETHIKKDKGLVLRGVTLNDAREWIRRQIAKLPSPNDVICSQYHPNWKDYQEQPACEGLEKEVAIMWTKTCHLNEKKDQRIATLDSIEFVNIARHFAQWGAEHLKK